MKLSIILNHSDFDWKLRRQQPKVTEMFLAIVEKLTGLKANTDKHSPVKKAANEFTTRAKKMKGGSELDFQAREKFWMESYEIVEGNKEFVEGEKDKDIVEGGKEIVEGHKDESYKIVEGNKELVEGVKEIMEENEIVEKMEESIEEGSRIQTLRKKIVFAQEKSLEYKMKHKKIMMLKEAKLQSNYNIKVSNDNIKKKIADLKNLQSAKSAEKSLNKYIPDVDILLKLPERPDTVGKTSDELLDKMDEEILKKDIKYKEDSAKLDREIEIGQNKKKDFKRRLKKNALLRDRLAQEISKSKLKFMFESNLDYLKSIENGETFSARHCDFHKSESARQALLYKMITDPFTEEQVDWVLKELKDIWMKNSKDVKKMADYIWKVILPECLIKLYSDFFEVSRSEAETMIKETPLEDESEDESDNDHLEQKQE